MAAYQLRPEAKRDLEKIRDYTVERFSATQAKKYINEIFDVIELISKNSKMGRPCDFIRDGYRSAPSGSHLIFYSETDGNIIIVRVLHKNMDVRLHL